MATKKVQHIGLVKNDAWLEPFEDAIRGRHEHALWKLNQLTTMASRNSRTLPMAIFIMVSTAPIKDGCCVSGHQMPLTSTWLAISTTGRSRTSTK